MLGKIMELHFGILAKVLKTGLDGLLRKGNME